MAIAVNAGEVKRDNLYWVPPDEIIIKEENRGRWKPPTDDEIVRMAESLLANGQRQPVECRKVENKRLQLVLGFTRAAAARLIVKGFTNSNGEVVPADEKFKLQCIVALGNEKEALLHNIVENAIRKDTSPMDDAINQRKLTEAYGYDDQMIANLYGYRGVYGLTKIKNLRRLLEFDDFFRDKIHYGELAVQTALTLLEVDADKRMETYEAACKSNGKVDGQVIRQEARESILANGILNDDDAPFKDEPSTASTATPAPKKAKATSAAAAPAAGANVNRSMRELRTFFTAMKDSEEATDNEKHLAKTVLGWVGGTMTDRKLQNAIRKLQE